VGIVEFQAQKHTEGNWKAVRQWQQYIIEALGIRIAVVDTDECNVGLGEGEGEANANLIAAAPEMASIIRLIYDEYMQVITADDLRKMQDVMVKADLIK
jgi:hypothetical protein